MHFFAILTVCIPPLPPPAAPPTGKGTTGGAAANVVNPAENNGILRPQASCPSSAQSRDSQRPHFLIVNWKIIKKAYNTSISVRSPGCLHS